MRAPAMCSRLDTFFTLSDSEDKWDLWDTSKRAFESVLFVSCISIHSASQSTFYAKPTEKHSFYPTLPSSCYCVHYVSLILTVSWEDSSADFLPALIFRRWAGRPKFVGKSCYARPIVSSRNEPQCKMRLTLYCQLRRAWKQNLSSGSHYNAQP